VTHLVGKAAMTDRIFLAGAAGAVGRRLVPLLIAAGHEVFGTTRSEAKAETIRALGGTPVLVDVFDAEALNRALVAAKPTVVMHQLTDLPFGLPPDRMAEAAKTNTRIRQEGTRNLVAAAKAAGARSLIAQSIAWVYAPANHSLTEADPINPSAVGVISLEEQVLGSVMTGIVLRYGHFYGPGSGVEGAADPRVHVDAAAQAALLAMGQQQSGVFNIAEPSPGLATSKARDLLGWDADFRLPSSFRR
jgi:nucleoside-diphosphate-sugar epimerase